MIKYKPVRYLYLQSITILIISVNLVASTTIILRRELNEDESNDGEQNDENDDDNSNNGGNDYLQVVYDAEARVESDLGNMWASSPSEWIAEYWEVFSGILLIVIFILFRMCYIPSPAERENAALLQQIRQHRTEIRELNTKQESIVAAAVAIQTEDVIKEKETLLERINKQETELLELKMKVNDDMTMATMGDGDTVTLATVGEGTLVDLNKSGFRRGMERAVDNVTDKMGAIIESWDRNLDKFVDPCSDQLFGPVDRGLQVHGGRDKRGRHRDSHRHNRSQQDEESTPYVMHNDAKPKLARNKSQRRSRPQQVEEVTPHVIHNEAKSARGSKSQRRTRPKHDDEGTPYVLHDDSHSGIV